MNLRKKNILFLPAEIEEKAMKRFCKKFSKINNKRKRIFIIIDSYGGDAAIAFNLVSLIKKSKSKIITIANGECHSAAALVFLAGDVKIITKKSSMGMHPPAFEPNFSLISFMELTKAYKEACKYRNMAVKLYKQNTKLPKYQIEKYLRKEERMFYFSDMKKYKMADYFVDSLNEIKNNV